MLFNALLATLNARHELREAMYAHGGLISVPVPEPVSRSSGAQTASSATIDIRADPSRVGPVWGADMHGKCAYVRELPVLNIGVEKEVEIQCVEGMV